MNDYFTNVLSNLLNNPGCCTVVACNFPQETFKEFHKFTAGYAAYNMDFSFGACMVTYEQQRVYFRQISDIREAYRFAGVSINLLLVDMFMPPYVLDYMRSILRPIFNDDGTQRVSGTLVLTDRCR